MKILAVDIGNTALRAGVVHRGLVDPSFHSRRQGAESGVPELFDWCVRALEADDPPESVVVSSVVAAASQLWTHLYRGKSLTRARPWILVDHRIPLPFRVDVEHPETVGADRFCNVAGAQARGMESALVVDLGTANTYDLLWEGSFRGGLIAPGCAESHRALIDGGSALPDVPFVHSSARVGRNTREAIEAGSFRQALAGVAGLIEAFREDYPGIGVLLTGGMAETLGPELPGRPLYLPDLTLEGGAAIARFDRPTA